MTEKTETVPSEQLTDPKSEVASPAPAPSALNAAPAEPPAEAAPAPEFVAFDQTKLELPEGFTLEEEQMAAFSEFATANKLSHDAAKALIEGHYIPALTKVHESVAAAVEKEWAETQTTWTKQLHETFGGEAGVTKIAQQAAPIIDKFGGKELREALDVTGMGNHPAMFKFFSELSKVLGEATPLPGGNATGGEQSITDALYPTMAKKK